MANVRLVLDRRKKNIDETYPIKLRVSGYNDYKRYKTKFSATELDFEKLLSGKHLSDVQRKKKSSMDALVAKANEIADNLEPFTFELFEKRMSQKGDRTDLISLLREKADVFEEEEKFGSMNLYRQTANLVEQYHFFKTNAKIQKVLPLSVVTPSWLKSFEKWALSLKKEKKTKDGIVNKNVYSTTTLSMYLIRVRSIFNDAISDKVIMPDIYPFHKPENKNGYKIPKAGNNKRPLSKEEIMAIYRYPTKTAIQAYHRDLFIFSYLASGMNMADVLTLRWENVYNDHFSFIRRKTAAKLSSSIVINIPLTKQLRAIIQHHGTDREKHKRVFNAIPDNAKELEIKKIISIYISAINANLKKIAASLGFTEGISTYFARHAYSNNLMTSEAPIAFISKQLGHQDIKTTQAYLDSFSTCQAAKYQENLLDDDE